MDLLLLLVFIYCGPTLATDLFLVWAYIAYIAPALTVGIYLLRACSCCTQAFTADLLFLWVYIV